MRHNTMTRHRYTPNELHARMVVTVGVLLAVVFAVVVIGFVYGLLFISQPMEQAPNDKEFISLMATIVTFLSGTLAGIVASNGIKTKAKNDAE